MKHHQTQLARSDLMPTSDLEEHSGNHWSQVIYKVVVNIATDDEARVRSSAWAQISATDDLGLVILHSVSLYTALYTLRTDLHFYLPL